MKAVITGAMGQDGTLLGKRLASEGWTVTGLVRPGRRGDWQYGELVTIDLTDAHAVGEIIRRLQPDHIYHLAACHHSSEGIGGVDSDHEMVTTNFVTTEVVLNAVARFSPSTRLLVAGSSQMYTKPSSGVLSISEETPMAPSTFYGMTKMWSRQLLAHYRSKRSTYAVMAILFNHESPLRPETFVTRKISIAAALALSSRRAQISIRDINATADWSDASEIVAGMHACLTAQTPSDVVLASGRVHTVAEVLECAFGAAGLNWRAFVDSPSKSETSLAPSLVGNTEHARAHLGWVPKCTLQDIMQRMVAADISRVVARA